VRLGAVGETVKHHDDGTRLVGSVGNEGRSDDGVRESRDSEGCEMRLWRDVFEALEQERAVVAVRRRRLRILHPSVGHKGLRDLCDAARSRMRRGEGATGDEGPEPEARHLDSHPERCALHGRI
jgi:hypothetical protein